MTAPSRTAPRRGSGVWLLGMGCGALATLAMPTALLAAVLLAPGLIAFGLDASPGRRVGRPVLFCGLAGALHPMLALWGQGGGVADALSLAADLPTLGIAWAAQGAGWLLCELAPLAIMLAQSASNRVRAAKLRAERAALQRDWGLPPPPE